MPSPRFRKRSDFRTSLRAYRLQPRLGMLARPLRPRSVALIITAAFLVGAGSAEVAVRTHTAIERVRQEREVGSAGQLVQLEISAPGGEVLARPRLIAPVGKTAEVVLHDPAHPDAVRIALRVGAVREPSGEIALDYAVWMPQRAIAAKGKVSLTPGVEQEMDLGEGVLVASFLAIPVPSAAFDAYLEAEGVRRAPGNAT